MEVRRLHLLKVKNVEKNCLMRNCLGATTNSKIELEEGLLIRQTLTFNAIYFFKILCTHSSLISEHFAIMES